MCELSQIINSYGIMVYHISACLNLYEALTTDLLFSRNLMMPHHRFKTKHYNKQTQGNCVQELVGSKVNGSKWSWCKSCKLC